MSFLFRTDSIFYNAFYAVQDITSHLSYDQTLSFCALLNKKIRDAFADQNLCCNAVFDLNTSDDRFFDSSQNEFLRMDDGVLYYGTLISEERIDLINRCYVEMGLGEILAETRTEFAALLNSGDADHELQMKESLRQESWQLSIV